MTSDATQMASTTNAHVVIVNCDDCELGTEEKLRAHRNGGILHRAFSVFIVNHRGDILLQRRASAKYHSGNLWSNACCGHPQANVAPVLAATVRLREELGFDTELAAAGKVLYRLPVTNDLTEWELNQVMLGEYSGQVSPDPAEVSEITWMRWLELRSSLDQRPGDYTPWFPLVLDTFARNAESRLMKYQTQQRAAPLQLARGRES